MMSYFHSFFTSSSSTSYYLFILFRSQFRCHLNLSLTSHIVTLALIRSIPRTLHLSQHLSARMLTTCRTPINTKSLIPTLTSCSSFIPISARSIDVLHEEKYRPAARIKSKVKWTNLSKYIITAHHRAFHVLTSKSCDIGIRERT